MVFFLIMVMIIGSQQVLRSVVTQGRRERETEMIWRGNQYVRAIRLFYRKTGHYPQTLDDLEKGLPELHFLRAVAYKDPMNKADGSWRPIFVNAAGQITGSTRYASMQQMALMDLNGGKSPTPSTGNAAGESSATNSSDSNSQQSSAEQDQQPGQNNSPSQGTSPSPAQNTSFSQNNPGMGANGPGAGSNIFGGASQPANAAAQGQPTGPVDGPVLGAFITGVGAGHNYDGRSVKVYRGGKTYQQWEFIWNPLEDQARALQSGLSQQGQQPGLPIANPNGGAGTVAPGATNPPAGEQPPPQPTPDQPLVQ